MPRILFHRSIKSQTINYRTSNRAVPAKIPTVESRELPSFVIDQVSFKTDPHHQERNLGTRPSEIFMNHDHISASTSSDNENIPGFDALFCSCC